MRLIPRRATAGPCFTDQLGRREFVTAASAIAGAALLPAVATANRRPARPADGTVVLFQGDSITDAGRDRNSAAANVAGGLRAGDPPLGAPAPLAGHAHTPFHVCHRA